MTTIIRTNQYRHPWKGVCAIGLQVGTRTFLDTGGQASGVFGLTGWEEPCNEPVVARCQLAINGKAAPYYWLACANPLHQRDAWEIQHLDSDGYVTHTTQGTRVLEETNVITPLSYEQRWHTPTATPIKVKKPRKKRAPRCSIDVDIVTEQPIQSTTSSGSTGGRFLMPATTETSKPVSKSGKRKKSV